MRLDKLLNDYTAVGRSQIKKDIKNGLVFVNGQIAKKPEQQISDTDKVCYKNELISLQKHYYYMLHKPAGVVSATVDSKEKTVLDLLDVPEGIKKSLFPVGRLDKDTEGLLLITDDGLLAHELLSPKKHVDKQYFCKLRESISQNDIVRLCEGVDIGEDAATLPAKAYIGETEKELYLTIQEGKFHQVKRMLHAVNNEVVYLKRLSMGTLNLDESLQKGQYRELTQEEIEQLTKR